MSRCRITAKVRTNPDYRALAAHLDYLGFAHHVVRPTGKGHPALRITLPDGRDVDYTISCTPMGGCNTAARVARLKRFLGSHGF